MDDAFRRLPGNEERWAGSKTLGETIYEIVANRQTNGEAFKSLLKFYGREKVKKLYEEELEKRKKRG
jgi:hypothetical protein